MDNYSGWVTGFFLPLEQEVIFGEVGAQDG